ncbi:MAG: hypothetical protein AB7Q17_14545 [Phycisphaerae bacterium]
MGSFDNLFKAARDLLGKKAVADDSYYWFGKLPTYGDYLERRSAPRWAQQFRQWLLDGFGRLATAAGARGAVLAPAAGVVMLPDHELRIIFALRDFGGDAVGRAFPFVVFAAAATVDASEPLAVLGAELVGVREIAATLEQQPARPAQTADITATWEQSRFAPNPAARGLDWRTAWRQLSWGDWFHGLRPAPGAKGADWCAAVEAWGRTLASHDGGDFEYNVRVPLSTAGEWAAQATGWLQWLSRYVRLEPQRLSLLATFDPSGPGLSALRRAVVPEDVRLLTRGWSELRYIDAPFDGLADPSPALIAKLLEKVTAPELWGEFATQAYLSPSQVFRAPIGEASGTGGASGAASHTEAAPPAAGAGPASGPV